MAEHKHKQTIEGHAPPADIFQSHLMGVELFQDMDAVFQQARKVSAGQHQNVDSPTLTEGQRCVAILTPGRLIMLDACPEPNSVPEAEVLPMLSVLPSKSPLNISVISYTRVEALTTDMSKAIPFRGYLIAWAYSGHNVIVFEGHPSAFDSGVRDADMLLMDSGMVPFVQFDWVDAAQRVMRPEGKIFLHDRKTFTLSLYSKIEGQPTPNVEAKYVEFLLRILMRAPKRLVDVTAGEMVPDLLELATSPTDRDWISRSIDRDKIDAEKVIELLLQTAGWRWYNPFKTTGVLNFRMPMNNGTVGQWKFTLTLSKSSAGKRQLRIER